MNQKVAPDHYPEIIKVYNSEGKNAAYDLIRSQFGIKNPTYIVKRMKQAAELFYNAEQDRFETHCFSQEEEIFMDLEDLCGTSTAKTDMTHPKDRESQNPLSMEKLVQTLISDRLLEMSKYITMDPVGRQIIVDKTSMQADGYRVSIS